jgi:3-oxoacyl-[acyl-carrier protein] reductase
MGGRTLDEEMASRKADSPAQRFGRTDQLGAVCAFCCSRHAGYLTGQNIMLDGGAYPGTF